MKLDKARKLTDKRLFRMERKLKKIYKEANKELQIKWNAYFNSISKRLEVIDDNIRFAIKENDEKLLKDLEYERKRLLRNLTLDSQRYNDTVNEIAERLANTNKVALNYINGQMSYVYTTNYNQFAISSKNVKGYSFSIVDEETVRHLASTNHGLLPNKKLNIQKDIRWNKKAINSQVLQGIMQGENVKKIAKRLENVTDMNYKSAVRNARTMTTCAENKGRQASYSKATQDGVKLKKVWMSTFDDRTRVTHSMLDGQERDPEDNFEIEGYELLYPGDTGCAPEMVYNCRCTTGVRIIGFR